MANDNPKISVRFEHASVHEDKPFEQPLFYIAMNIKHRLLKEQGKAYNEKMISEDFLQESSVLQVPQVLPRWSDGFYSGNTCPQKGGEACVAVESCPLEIAPSCLSDTDFNLNYIMDRYISDIQFKYKGSLFTLKTDKEDVKHHPFKTGHDRFTVTSTYIISYAQSDFALFEDFIKTSLNYFKKFADGHKMDKKKLKMFISSQEGDYFTSIGTRPKRSLESIFLPKEKKSNIVQLITRFLDPKTVQLYRDFGINHKLTILLEGVPGTGKSSLIAALASHFNFNLAMISFTPKMTDVSFINSMRMWERKRSEETNNDDDERDTLLCIEDIDCIFKERKSNDESRNMVTFSGILNALDGITTSENQIVILTTNHIEHLDPALIRPGRVDHIMRFDYAVKEQIKEIFTVYTRQEQVPTVQAQAQAQAVQAQAQAQAVQAQAVQAQAAQQAQSAQQAPEKAQEFYEAVKNLNIKITTSLLQQYLLKYANNSALIFENIDELKTMYDACNKQRGTDEAKMYT